MILLISRDVFASILLEYRRIKMICRSSFLNEAIARGLVYQNTNLEALDKHLSTPGQYAYVGFDITARSLHVGHLLPILTMRLFQKHGHKPIILLGGGTTKVGDPSFKNTTRPMLSDEQIADNLKGIRCCLDPFLEFGENKAVMLNNADWLCNLNYLDFLREIGKYFSVNRMIGFDSVKAKLTENNSLSFLEFNYMTMQAYDFYHLFKEHGCRIQLGGQDQWGNIICGVELIRKKCDTEVFGLTNPLLTTSDGKKMGKTANGAVWLTSDLLSDFDFWQYWRNVDDADVIKLMYLLSDLPVDEIKKMESIQGQELNEVKIMLADAATALVRGKNCLDEIHQSTTQIFNENNADLSKIESLPRIKIDKTKSLIGALVESNLFNSDAKRLVRGNGVYVNGEPVDESYEFNEKSGTLLKLSCGKKRNVILEII